MVYASLFPLLFLTQWTTFILISSYTLFKTIKSYYFLITCHCWRGRILPTWIDHVIIYLVVGQGATMPLVVMKMNNQGKVHDAL